MNSFFLFHGTRLPKGDTVKIHLLEMGDRLHYDGSWVVSIFFEWRCVYLTALQYNGRWYMYGGYQIFFNKRDQSKWICTKDTNIKIWLLQGTFCIN